MKAEATRAAATAKASVSTPETTAEQLEAGSSPTTKEAPAKAKKPTLAETRAELEDLRSSAATTRQKLTQSEITFQRARTILRNEGTPGLSMQQDHYRLQTMISDLRKLFRVEPDEVSGG
ncbi:hypothetical protein SEA_NOSHOW_47 [Mycobacterium phage NoShow]|nr:hypothetical protein SEA_NOSHOW_47 [Mycobacterium phage NoShow]